MRTSFFKLLLVFIFALCGMLPASAQTISTQCSVDKQVIDGNTTYRQCPFGAVDNYLISQGYNGARLEPDIVSSTTPMWLHGVCRYTDADGITNPVFIPFNTSNEWNAFINNVPAGVGLANCCLPRGMIVGDVPEPTSACARSVWRLDGLVDPDNFNTLIAVPESLSPTAKIQRTVGAEVGDYPIEFLPIERDDIGSTLPMGAYSTQTYVGRYSCFGIQPVGNEPASTNTYAYVRFRMTCRNTEWEPIDPNECIEKTEYDTETCQEAGYGSGYSGEVYVRLRRVCPSGQISRTVVRDTCKTTCTPGQVGGTFTENCPADYKGVITYRNIRVCPSGELIKETSMWAVPARRRPLSQPKIAPAQPANPARLWCRSVKPVSTACRLASTANPN